MIWTDEETGRRWIVRFMGRVGGPATGGAADKVMPDGAIVLAFESLGANNESHVITGAPENWAERPEILAQLFDRANRRRPDDA